MCDYQFEEKTVHLIYASQYEKYWTISDFGPGKKLEWVTAEDLKYVEKYSAK